VAINSLEEDPELFRLRGTSKADEEVHKLVSWTTRKDYNTLVGISLPIKDWAGEDHHAIQFWEETTEPIGAMDNPAADMYVWLVSRIRERSQTQSLPQGMPETFTELSVQTQHTGEAGYILYEPLDSLAGRITEMPIRVRIGYDYGHTKIGMGERHTLATLAAEFWQLTHNSWNMFPEPSTERDLDGTIVHKVSQDPNRFYHSLLVGEMDIPPVRIQEDNASGTAINHAADQAHMLQYWAWSQQPVRTGIGVNINNYSCEYWLDISLQQIPDENEGQAYFAVLHQLWLAEI
jgi:hypothetical protein